MNEESPKFWIGRVFFARSISEAKNDDELFREDKFHAANGKTQACSQGALPLFILGLVWGWGGERGFVLSFPHPVVFYC
jgi:hypothetical protein